MTMTMTMMKRKETKTKTMMKRKETMTKTTIKMDTRAETNLRQIQNRN
jgi:hypothetical protein